MQVPDSENIINYIPQRKPMIMVDRIISATENAATTEFEILPDNIFCINGFFTEAGLLENIAQTAASMVGYQCVTQNKPVPPGFIGSIKNLIVNQFPSVGDKLLTKIEVVNEVFGVTIINGQTFLKNDLIASGEFKIFIAPEK